MSKNRLQGAEAGKALGDALAGNTVLKELDLSGSRYYPNMDIEFVKAFTPGLSDNGAMTKFDISSNDIRAEGGKALAEGLKGNQAIKELNFSGNNLGYNSNDDSDTSGIIAIADVIPGMGALSKLIFGGEEYFDAEREEYVTPEPATLEVGMTEADFSNKNLGVGGAIIISAWLTHKDNGAMTALNLSSNDIGGYTVPDGWKYFPNNTRNTRFYNTATKKNQGEPPKGACQAGVIAIANAIPNMRALSLLNLTDNSIGEVWVQKIKGMCGSRTTSLLIN
jgi:hypothetical protein